ncbi:hypothetical protein [Streptomyces sp. G-5]|uniref:hypothetical protein n=1 Tax=Streptomyces sp. G-5 TaxID=2977231 RepID=UPI0004CB3561|nr:hypothetical protein [Streptomyces sp. G-5]MCU4746656.1 hypothetical protein [Streptomyces sp. G-5]
MTAMASWRFDSASVIVMGRFPPPVSMATSNAVAGISMGGAGGISLLACCSATPALVIAVAMKLAYVFRSTEA